MVDRVTGLTSLSSFGAYLQGNTDIDNNQYRGNGTSLGEKKLSLQELDLCQFFFIHCFSPCPSYCSLVTILSLSSPLSSLSLSSPLSSLSLSLSLVHLCISSHRFADRSRGISSNICDKVSWPVVTFCHHSMYAVQCFCFSVPIIDPDLWQTSLLA